MASSSVQFRGTEGVVEAFENRAVAAWSIWQGKQFMFKHEGTDVADAANQLLETLELLAGSTNAIYTLKVYEDLNGAKIKSNTPDDGSFNFKINGEDQLITNNQYSRYNNSNAIAERLERIEQRLQAQEEEEEGEDEPENRLGLIGEIISHPTIQPLVQTILTNVLGIGKTNAATPAPMPRVAISGVNDTDLLKQAIEELQKHDTNLPQHLAKLAQIAKDNPASFQFLLNTLDSM